MRIILFLILVDLKHMVSAMRAKQPSSGGFRHMGVDSVQEYTEVVGIARQTGKRGILLTLIPRSGGFRVLSHRVDVDTQQSLECLRQGFTVEWYQHTRNLFCIGIDFLLDGIALRRTVLHAI